MLCAQIATIGLSGGVTIGNPLTKSAKCVPAFAFNRPLHSFFFTAMSVGLRYPYLLSSIPGGTKLLSLFAPLFVYFKWNSGSFIATEEDEVLRPSTADYERPVGSP